MWIVLLMSALMLGTAMSVTGGSDETESDEQEANALVLTGEDPGDVDIVPLDQALADPETLIAGDESASDGDDESEVTDLSAEPDGPDPETIVPGISVVNTGEETVFGSEGNDTLSADTFGPITITTSATDIQLLGGDDVVEFGSGSLFTTNIDGGAGNDTISGIISSPLSIVGGSGNDVLSSISEGSIDGGDGNDTITSDITGVFDANVVLEGGDGDDIIQVTTDITEDDAFAGQADMYGGAGEDRFELNLALTDTAPSAEDPTAITVDSFISIFDFDADEDVLQIEIIRPEGAEARDIASTTLTRVEDGDGSVDPYTDVDLTFAATDTQEAVITTFRVYSDAPITLDDIAFVESA